MNFLICEAKRAFPNLMSFVLLTLLPMQATAVLPVSTARAPAPKVVSIVDGEAVEYGTNISTSFAADGYGTLTIHLDVHGAENTSLIVRPLARNRPEDEFCFIRKENGQVSEVRWNQGRDDLGSRITFTGISAPELAIWFNVSSSAQPIVTMSAYLE